MCACGDWIARPTRSSAATFYGCGVGKMLEAKERDAGM